MHAAQSGPAPDGRVSVPIRVLRIDPGTAHQALMLSESYSGLFTHWVRGRSTFCDDGPCPDCGRFPERFWKGYVAALAWEKAGKRWLPVVLEISEALELDFRGKYRRGQVWRIGRGQPERRKQPPIRGAIVDQRAEERVPPAHDVKPCLVNLYHNVNVRLGWKSPLPDRATAEVPDCAPPPGETVPAQRQGPAVSIWERVAESGTPAEKAEAQARIAKRGGLNGTAKER